MPAVSIEDVSLAVARDAGPYILALIETVADESNGAVVLTALTALTAYVLARYDVEVPKFAHEVAGMMERRAALLAKRSVS